MKRKIAVEVISFLFIVLFVYAALNKLLDVEKFRVQIGQSPILTSVAPFVAWFIPMTELTIAVLLGIGRFRLLALYASFGIMTMFTAYIVTILNFSDHIPCACGGVLEALGWQKHLVFNIAFTLLALLGILIHAKIARHKALVS